MGETSFGINGGKIPQWAAKVAFGVIGAIGLALGIYAVSGVSELSIKVESTATKLNGVEAIEAANNKGFEKRFDIIDRNLEKILERINR